MWAEVGPGTCQQPQWPCSRMMDPAEIQGSDSSDRTRECHCTWVQRNFPVWIMEVLIFYCTMIRIRITKAPRRAPRAPRRLLLVNSSARGRGALESRPPVWHRAWPRGSGVRGRGYWTEWSSSRSRGPDLHPLEEEEEQAQTSSPRWAGFGAGLGGR